MGAALSNNVTAATLLTNPSNRFSMIFRTGYTIVKGLRADLEYGYQPYRDKTYEINNYDDQYVYFRLSYDFNTK